MELEDRDIPNEATLEAARQDMLPAFRMNDSTGCPEFSPPYTSYPLKALDSAPTGASRAALWEAICQFGNDDDYFSCGILWWLRRSCDWLLGGPSFRRQRRDPRRLHVGDVVDSWRVIASQAEHRLALLVEMKLPGTGVLEFEIMPGTIQREVRATAYFNPEGVWGLLYWYPLIPFHHLLFRGMTREIVRRAQSIDAR